MKCLRLQLSNLEVNKLLLVMIKHFKDSKEILLYLKSNPIWISAFANGEGCFTASLMCYLKGMWGLQPQM